MATANELRQMTRDELSRMAEEARQNLFNLNLKHRTGHLENTAEIGHSRKDLARLMTVIRESDLGIARQVHAEAAKAPKAEAAGTEEGAEKGAKKKGAAKAAKAPKAAKAKKAAK